MAKLYAKERNALPDELFGLPDERKFPLTDEEHVRKAIQFFKFCPPAKRAILANNINKRAKELNMKLRISENNPFYKFAAKQIVNESFYGDCDVYEFERLVELGSSEVERIINQVQKLTTIGLNHLVNRLFSISSIQDLLEIEKQLFGQIMHRDAFIKVERQIKAREHSINPIALINKALRKAYTIIFEFIAYNTKLDLTTSKKWYEILEDIFFYLKRSIHNNPNKEDVQKKLAIIEELMKTYSCNFYYIGRKLKELQWDCNIYIREEERNIGNKEKRDARLAKLEPIYILIENFLNNFREKTDKTVATFMQTPSVLPEVLRSSNMNLVHLTNYLNTLKTEINNEINIILLASEMNIGGLSDETQFFLGIDPYKDHDIYSAVSYLEGEIREENIRLYQPNLTMKLDSVDIMALTNLDKFERLYVGKDYKGDPVHYGIRKGKLYLLLKNKNICGEYYLLTLVDGKMLPIADNLYCRPEYFDYTKKAKAIKINICPQQEKEPESLTEGLFINAEGDLKFKFKPKKTYMDEYAENHKILVANYKAKNYEGMKVNLAFLFALINHVEREILYNKKYQGTEKLADAQKARMFAMNDFKTYMKKLLQAEPGFDFTKYYEESDYGKLTINIKKDEVIGLKKLFRAIMFS